MSSSILPGGAVGFVARDPTCDTINVMSLGIPGYSIHHVGIVSRHEGRLLLCESTSSGRPPCAIRGVHHVGPGAIDFPTLFEWAAENKVKLWYYGLRCPLYPHEEERLDAWLVSKFGLEYDLDGALHAGGGLLFRTLAILMRGEDMNSLFCSEYVMAGLTHVGRVITPNVSMWNPNRSVRYLTRTGICSKPIRIF